jgi:hypothetical protein
MLAGGAHTFLPAPDLTIDGIVGSPLADELTKADQIRTALGLSLGVQSRKVLSLERSDSPSGAQDAPTASADTDLMSAWLTSRRPAVAHHMAVAPGVVRTWTTGGGPSFSSMPAIASPAVAQQLAGASPHTATITTGLRDASPPTSEGSTPSPADRARIQESYGSLPLRFEANHGQTDQRVDFLARGSGATIFLTPTEAVFALQNSESRIQNSESTEHDGSLLTPGPSPLSPHPSAGVALYMQIVGGNPAATSVGRERLAGATNYFIGNDPTKWHTDIPSYGRVEYADVYPGIDLVYYGNNQNLEYDFVVAPGADPGVITLNFAGADGLEINGRGDLVQHTAVGDVLQKKPFVYQELNGSRHEIASSFVLNSARGTVGFDLGVYDPTRPLVIDPVVLGYSTYLGGVGDDLIEDMVVDADGNAYLTGYTDSLNFPVTAGAFDQTYNGGNSDVFVTKLNPSGSGLVYSTLLGGSGSNGDVGYAIAVDRAGNAYVTGRTFMNFPTTAGAFDTTWNGGGSDAFVAKLDAGGSALLYSTFLGGSGEDIPFAIQIDAGGNAYVAGRTFSTNFPTKAGSFDTTFGGVADAFVTKLNATGTALAYSTYLGGSDDDIALGLAVDPGGRAYIAGRTSSANFPIKSGSYDTIPNGVQDAFVTKLNQSGSALEFSTFLGGSGWDDAYSIAVDSYGNALVTGTTYSNNFPTIIGAFDTSYGGSGDAFVAQVGSGGSALYYSTFLGGSGPDGGRGITLDRYHQAWVTGITGSSNFFTSPGAFDPTHNGGTYDTFLAKVGVGGAWVGYSSFLGGSAWDQGASIALDCEGNVFVAGWSTSTNFPTTAGSFDPYHRGFGDGFVTKFNGLGIPDDSKQRCLKASPATDVLAP